MPPNYNPKTIDNSNIRLLLEAATRLGIDWVVLDDDRYEILFEKAGNAPARHRKPAQALRAWHWMHAHTFQLNALDGIRLTRDKYRTFEVLKQHQVPVLDKITVASVAAYREKAKAIPFPQVVKPAEGEKGRQVFLNLPDQKTAEQALGRVLHQYSQAIIEPYFAGNDIRLLTLGHRVIGLSRRHPPTLTGDGKQTIKALIDQENQRRTELNEKAGVRLLNRFLSLSRIEWYLNQQGLSLDFVLPAGKQIRLHPLPNYSAGGWVETLQFDQIHPSFLKMAQDISRWVNLEIMGMDILIKNLKQPAVEGNCAVLELNSDPGIRLHDLPNKGQSQQVAEKILQHFFATHNLKP